VNLAETIEQAIDSLPMERRLYPDTYAAIVAKAIEPLLSEEYQRGWTDCQNLIAKQKGLRLSRKATDTQRNAVNLTLPRSGTKGAALWEWFMDAGDFGLTDDEVERKTGWTHQSASAMRNGLMHRGLLKDSGQRRKNRRGLDCIVWVRVSPSSKDADDRSSNPVPVPSDAVPDGNTAVVDDSDKYGPLILGCSYCGSEWHISRDCPDA
jgi:hypothetical protein